MWDIIRDSTVGTLLNLATRGRVLPFPDQRPGFELPGCCLSKRQFDSGEATQVNSRADSPTQEKIVDVEKDKPAANDEGSEVQISAAADHGAISPKSESVTFGSEKGDIEAALPPGKAPSLLNEPVAKHEYILVDWYGPDDQENPRNWSKGKKIVVMILINYLTGAVYIGSAIYTASIPGLVEDWGISPIVGTLGLSLYVLAYGSGPLFFSGLQELPILGRNPVYLGCLFIFAIIQIPTALSKNIGTLLVLRFIGGFVGSPSLACGPASLQDIYDFDWLAYAIGLWSLTACAAPTMGPIIGSYAAAAKGWTWPIWELSWIAGSAFVVLMFLLPETLPDTILLRRAQRLRKLTGCKNLRSMSEIQQAQLTVGEVASTYLIRPFQLMMEPAVFFLNSYLGLGYGIFYLWFEAFPIVFGEIWHFPQGNDSLPYLGIIIGACFAMFLNVLWNYYYINPTIVKNGSIPNETRLYPALFAGVMVPIALFIFGWTAHAHWIGPTIGAGLYMPGIFLLFQSILIYLPVSYPDYAASINAGNGFFRASMAAAFPVFGRPFFHNLGVGPACSLLAGIAIIMIPCMAYLISRGAHLRRISKYAHGN
ncbi:MFS general substrate transporter [Auriscalpium vulgare]|uniref:MFS general substrate transporter n=1 Tax=Auriscalpium vulgare TaxID=40419 RepID=A0ACB8R818_9AGAM|nr:MFS general substrate transporter [Auriscalpium vulgare]